MEQEVAYTFLHRHFVEHFAQLNGVLNGQGFTLLNLLRE